MSVSILLILRVLAGLGVFHIALTPLVFAGPLDSFFTQGSVDDLAAGDFRLALIFWVVLGVALVMIAVAIGDEIRFGQVRRAAALLGVLTLVSLAATILHPVSGFPAMFVISAAALASCLRMLRGAQGHARTNR